MCNIRGGGLRSSAVLLLAVLLVGGAAGAQSRLVRFAEIQPTLAALRAAAPATLSDLPAADADWSAWIGNRDREIRSRLTQGDEDTMLNWLLLGTSFTAQPPVVLDASAAADDQALRRMAQLIGTRIADLLRAIASPGSDERRLFARELLTARGFNLASPAGLDQAQAYLLTGIGRIIDEWTRLQRDRSPQFVDRGLSLDTSLQPNFAIERALAALRVDGVIRARSIARAAVVGAGLDFADKNTGFDFYPPQTLQPFALIDSLRRLDLAAPPDATRVVALDISPRVVNHVTRAALSAPPGGYRIHLPLDPARTWRPELRDYWRVFGDRIGSAVMPQRSPAAIEVRAVAVNPLVTRQVTAVDFNVVTQRLDGELFDLVVVTNVFIYYDTAQQAIALANIAAMLRPGGVLLTNDRLPDFAGLALRRGGAHQVVYTTDGAGDRIDWYLKETGR